MRGVADRNSAPSDTATKASLVGGVSPWNTLGRQPRAIPGVAALGTVATYLSRLPANYSCASESTLWLWAEPRLRLVGITSDRLCNEARPTTGLRLTRTTLWLAVVVSGRERWWRSTAR
ncbi:hypothetical protein LSAT2_005405 [Lamellibrachia satsuma]|nr:hypothetical protein LSAT2_005405 [Lamellibrachia satsuma]